MTAMGLQERFAMIDACTSYDELLALAGKLGRTPYPPRGVAPMRFVHNGDERVCLTCRGYGVTQEPPHDETEGGPIDCWRCNGIGTLP